MMNDNPIRQLIGQLYTYRPSPRVTEAELLKIIQRYQNQPDVLGQPDENGRTLLHLAASNGYLDAVQFLIEQCGFDVNAVDSFGCTPLMLTCTHMPPRVVDVMECLIAHKATVNSVTRDEGETPLHQAALNGHLEACRLLVEHGALVDKPTHDHFAYTPLHFAVNLRRLPVVKFLVEEAGADIRCKAGGNTSVSYLAACNNDVVMLTYLLEHGAPVIEPGPLYRVQVSRLLGAFKPAQDTTQQPLTFMQRRTNNHGVSVVLSKPGSEFAKTNRPR